ncbi:MAG: glycosyltransferase [Candidatus Omnitrophica bacterium]|nr:glycosyltransferase [Candidatus Omnitrophota bacterium]
MIDGLRVSVIIPCLNEADGLRQMLPKMPRSVDEVVVVDNGSTDETAAVASAAGVRVAAETRPGYGEACRRGLREATGDVIVKLDGDGTYPLSAIEPLVQTLARRQLDFVNGSRFPLQQPRAMSWVSRVGNGVLTLLANWCFGLSLRDSLSGMWAIRASALKQLHLADSGIPFSHEIKVEAFAVANLRAEEIPIGYASRIGRSKLAPLRDGWGCVRLLLRKRWLRLTADEVTFASIWLAVLFWPLAPALKNLAVGIAVTSWVLGKLRTRSLRPPQLAVNVWFCVWFAAGVVSMWHSVALRASVQGLFKIAQAVLICWVAAETLNRPSRLRAVLSAVVLSAAIVSIDGLLQLAFGVDPLRGRAAGHAPGGLPRLTATFGHANDFGIFAASVFPLCVVAAITAGDAVRRWWRWLVVALLSCALVLSYSRPGVTAVAASLLVFCVVRRAWPLLAGLAAAGVLLLLLLPAPVRAWAASQPSWWDALIQPERPQIWAAAWRMFAAHPVIGVGVNTFIKNYDRYKLSWDPIHSAYAHNHYLHLAAELGAIGLIAFAGIIAQTGRAFRRLLRSSDRETALLAAALGCGVVAFLVVGVFESALYSSHTNLGFWLWLGSIHGLAANNQLPNSNHQTIPND